MASARAEPVKDHLPAPAAPGARTGAGHARQKSPSSCWPADTEVDKTMVEGMADPLMHLVRNALDHGIEPPADRLAASPVGTLPLRASTTTRAPICEVQDDGAASTATAEALQGRSAWSGRRPAPTRRKTRT